LQNCKILVNKKSRQTSSSFPPNGEETFLYWKKLFPLCHCEVRIAVCKSTAFAAIRKGGRNFMRSKIPEPWPEVSIASLAKHRFACNAQGRREFYA